jgi:hypothetical protein
LREHLDQIPTSSDARCDDLEEASRPEILFGLQRLVTKEDILAAIPPRPEADQLMEAFFTIFETHASKSAAIKQINQCTKQTSFSAQADICQASKSPVVNVPAC